MRTRYKNAASTTYKYEGIIIRSKPLTVSKRKTETVTGSTRIKGGINMKRNPEETMKEAVPMNEKEALKKACDIVEAKIRERGGQMHTKSQIRTYKVGDEIVVRLDDVLELARVMKNKFREGKEPGYISRTEAEKISAFLALNHFQVVLLSNELSKGHHLLRRHR